MSLRLPIFPSKILMALAVAVIFLWTDVAAVQADGGNADGAGWKQMVSRRTVVHYRSMADLIRFNEKIAYFPGDLAIQSLTAGRDAEGIKGVLKKKLDKLFERAQEILGMRKRMDRVNIRIHTNRDDLNKTYREFFGGECRLRAWYLFETQTVYVNAEDTHEGMVAHEMGHHIIDHFFKTRPPAATAEILARYIDANLMADQ